MLTDLLWCLVLLVFAAYGLSRPYIALCGVIWVDILKPQNLSFSFLAGKPLSFIVTLIFAFSLVISLRKIGAPKRKLPTILLALFMAWLTLATFYAQFQSVAWLKYDDVIKTLLFPFFIPFVLNSRVKIETFVATMVAALGYFIMIGGMRTLLGSGAYGQSLVYSSDGDGGMTESSTLSMVAVLVLPFLYYLLKNSLFKVKIPYLSLLVYSFSIAAVLTTIGTYARTGLVGLLVLFSLLLSRSKNKLKILSIIVLLGIISVPFLPAEWTSRMATIVNVQDDSSAFGRVVVWRWTIDYVSQRPFMGGGFNSYMANAGELRKYIDSGELDIKERQNGKDFHNIYFQVLGEAGYVGLLFFLLIIYVCFSLNRETVRNGSSDWSVALANSVNMSLIVYCFCGLFIGVAYTPWLYYFLGISCSLHNVHSTTKCIKC